VSEQQHAAPDTGDTASAEQPPEAKPFFVVESGNPTPQEIAALTLVLAAAAGGDENDTPTPPVSGWARPVARMRRIGAPGPGAWRAEYAPR